MMSGFLTESGMLVVPGVEELRDAAGRLVVDRDGTKVLRGWIKTEGEMVVDSASLYWETGSKGDGYFGCDDVVM